MTMVDDVKESLARVHVRPLVVSVVVQSVSRKDAWLLVPFLF